MYWVHFAPGVCWGPRWSCGVQVVFVYMIDLISVLRAFKPALTLPALFLPLAFVRASSTFSFSSFCLCLKLVESEVFTDWKENVINIFQRLQQENFNILHRRLKVFRIILCKCIGELFSETLIHYQLLQLASSMFFREIVDQQLVANSSFATSRSASNGAPCRVAKTVQQRTLRGTFWHFEVASLCLLPPNTCLISAAHLMNLIYPAEAGTDVAEISVFYSSWMPSSFATSQGSKWRQDVSDETRGEKWKWGYFMGAGECLTWRKHRSGDPPPCWLCLLGWEAVHATHPSHQHTHSHTFYP